MLISTPIRKKNREGGGEGRSKMEEKREGGAGKSRNALENKFLEVKILLCSVAGTRLRTQDALS